MFSYNHICFRTSVVFLIMNLVMQSIGSLQKKYSIGSFELLSKTAPIQAISLLVFGPFIDYYLNGQFITNYKLSPGVIVSLLSLSLTPAICL